MALNAAAVGLAEITQFTAKLAQLTTKVGDVAVGGTGENPSGGSR